MIHFHEDGSSTIDFPNGPITIKAPTFGALKRLRSERVRLARKSEDDLAQWDAQNPEPGGEGDNSPDPVAIGRHKEDRVVAAEQFNLAATEAWWRLILLGDDTFKCLAEGDVPEDVDEWPSALIFDVRPVVPPGATLDVLLSAQSAPDRWVRHVANFRSRSGNGAAAGQNGTSL